jgi:DNA-binding transcriptional regulator YiaG
MSSVKPGSKYARLFDHLRLHPGTHLALSLPEIETILGGPLPASALVDRGFWSNRRDGLQSSAWLEAGFYVEAIDLEAGTIGFVRRSRAYTLRIEDGEVRWDGALVLALRSHLGMNQSELAEALGVRQQTVSEWESGQYEPSRSRSKHLSLIAERAGFTFDTSRSGD